MLNPYPFETGDSVLLWELQSCIMEENVEEARSLFYEIPEEKQHQKLENLISVFGWDESKEVENEIRTLFA